MQHHRIWRGCDVVVFSHSTQHPCANNSEIHSSTLSLLVLTVGLAVHINSALSSHHVAVLAKLFDGGSDLESSDWGPELRSRGENRVADWRRPGHRTETCKCPIQRGCNAEH